MLALILKELNAKRLSLLVYCLAGYGLLLMYVALFPSIQKQSAALLQSLQSLDTVFKSFGLQQVGFARLDQFLSLEYFSITWPLLAILLGLSRAGSSMAGEIEKGTMGLVLALPLSRLRIFWAKYISGLLALLVFTAVTIPTVIPLAAAFHISIDAAPYWKAALMCCLFAWAFYSLGMFLGAVFSERGRVYVIAGSAALIMYVAMAAANLKDSLGWLKNYSLFSYLDIQKILADNALNNQAIWVFVGIIILFSVAGSYWFYRRDIVI